MRDDPSWELGHVPSTIHGLLVGLTALVEGENSLRQRKAWHDRGSFLVCAPGGLHWVSLDVLGCPKLWRLTGSSLRELHGLHDKTSFAASSRKTEQH